MICFNLIQVTMFFYHRWGLGKVSKQNTLKCKAYYSVTTLVGQIKLNIYQGGRGEPFALLLFLCLVKTMLGMGERGSCKTELAWAGCGGVALEEPDHHFHRRCVKGTTGLLPIPANRHRDAFTPSTANTQYTHTHKQHRLEPQE